MSSHSRPVRPALAALVAVLLAGGLSAVPSPAVAAIDPPSPTRHVSTVGNPIIADGSTYTADAAPLVGADGRLYVYTGHDEPDEQVGGFVMDDYTVLATDDPASGEWDVYEENMVPGQVFAWASGRNAWAGQSVIGPDGRYYWYAPVQSKDTSVPNAMSIGVAVSDSPVGPWTDAIGEPLLDWTDVYGTGTAGQEIIDPTVLIDDDGSVYLYWGAASVARTMQLEPDMITKKGAITTVGGLDGFYEAPWVVKRGSTYHMVYDWKIGGSQCTPSNYQACIGWATAPSASGPWTYKGLIMDAGSATTMHPSLIEYENQWYITYHTKDAVRGGHFRRSVAIDEVSWDGDTILPIKRTRADDPAYRLTDNVALGATAAASFTEQPPMRLGALNDGFRAVTALLPPDMWGAFRGKSSTSASEWTSYTWDAPVRIDSAGLQFHEDPNWIRSPRSWRLDYLDAAGDWRPVEATGPYPTSTNSWLSVDFAPVTTTALRATYENQLDTTGAYHSVAVSEWEVYAVPPSDAVSDVDVSTVPGSAPVLPLAVRVSDDASTTRWAPVNWRDVDPQAYAQSGDFDIEGRVLGDPRRSLLAHVEVTPDATEDPAPADSTAPEVSIALQGSEGSSGWYSSDVVARVRSEDSQDYLATIDARVGSGAWLSGSAPQRWREVSISSVGSTTVEGRARDAAGNESTVATRTVKIDKTAPEVTAAVDSSTRATTVTGSDALSGLGSATYRFGRSGSFAPFQLGTPVPAPADGQPTTFAYRVTDVAGNVTTGSVVVPADPEAELSGNLAPLATATTSSASAWAPPAGLNDGTGEPLVDDASTLGAMWGTWPVVGEQTATYTWGYDVRLDRSGVWWGTDASDEANVGLIPPRSWVLEYLDADGTTWRPVALGGSSSYGRARNTYNTVEFAPVTTRSVRIRAQSWGASAQQGSVGISEWQVIAAPPGSADPTTVTAAAPTFSDPVCTGGQASAGTTTIPTSDGVTYLVDSQPVTGTISHPAGSAVAVTAVANDGFVLAAGSQTQWEHTFASPTCASTGPGPSTTPTGPVPAPSTTTFTGLTAPKLVGSARVGSSLRVRMPDVVPAPTRVVYRWFVDGKRLRGERARSLRLTPAMLGRKVKVVVVLMAPGLADATSPSRPRTIRPR